MKHINTTKIALLAFFVSLTSLVFAQEQGETDFECSLFNFESSCEDKPVISAPILIKKKFVRENFIKNEIVLSYPNENAGDIKNIAQKYNLKTISKDVLGSVETGLLLASTNGQNSLSLSKIINKKEKNVAATTNNTFKLAATTFKNAYSMYETGVKFVHKTTKGKGISICMIDTPVDIFHPSLSQAHIETLDLIDFDFADAETMLHGTSVAGVLVSQNEHIGISPQAKLLAISAFSTTKARPYILQGTSANIAKAIDSCILHKVDVINLSFTGGQDALMKKLVMKAIEKGIIVVAAGGNGGHWGSTIYPAVIPGVLATTAVDENKKLFDMADKGSFIDYAAPGVNILTIAPGGKYKLASGTSISSAHVSGIVALLLSQRKGKEIGKALTETAIDLGKPGRDQEFGDGLVNASRALAIIKKSK